MKNYVRSEDVIEIVLNSYTLCGSCWKFDMKG